MSVFLSGEFKNVDFKLVKRGESNMAALGFQRNPAVLSGYQTRYSQPGSGTDQADGPSFFCCFSTALFRVCWW